MHWFLNISDGENKYVLKAEQLYINHQIEQIKVTAEGISVILESNRPLLKEIGLKRPATWKIIRGKLKDHNAFELITKTLEESFTE